MTSAHDYDDPGKPKIAWDDKQAREQLVDALVSDALAVLAALAALAERGEPEPGPQADAVGLLALIAGQDVELLSEPTDPENPDGPGGPPRWRIARKVAHDRVISVVDPDARHAHKTVHRRQDGFKAHLAIEPDSGLVTACRLTKATGAGSHDASVGIDLLTDETSQVEVLGDSAYATGEALATFADTGHSPLVPVRSAVPGGFTAADFDVDEAAGRSGTVTCPAGITRPMDRTRKVKFGKVCSSCPLVARCTTSTSGRTLLVGEHDALQRAHRQRA